MRKASLLSASFIVFFVAVSTYYSIFKIKEGKAQMSALVSERQHLQKTFDFFERHDKLVNPWYNYHYQKYGYNYVTQYVEVGTFKVGKETPLLEGVCKIYQNYCQQLLKESNEKLAKEYHASTIEII